MSDAQTFNSQEISEHHHIDKMHLSYEILSPIRSTDGPGMTAIKNLSAYLRNEQGQRRYSHDKDQVTPFVVTREYQTGGIVIYHFYVQGERSYAIHWVKADGKAIHKRPSAQAG